MGLKMGEGQGTVKSRFMRSEVLLLLVELSNSPSDLQAKMAQANRYYYELQVSEEKRMLKSRIMSLISRDPDAFFAQLEQQK
jgi:hypothetical protein